MSLYLLYRYAIGRPLETLVKSVAKLEGSSHPSSVGDNEITQVTNTVTTFVDNVLQLSRRTSGELDAAIGESAAAISQTNEVLDNQRSQTNEVARHIASMSKSARRMAESGVDGREVAATVAGGRSLVKQYPPYSA